MTPDEVAKSMELEGFPKVFFVGKGAGRVTFVAQQRRAINLTWALAEQGVFKLGAHVAVIGGGLAGMTAAVAAKIHGCKVTLLEAELTLMHLQRGNTTRYVHPNVYDWPEEISKEPVSNLPFLNWSEGDCRSVSLAVLSQWDQVKGGICERLGTRVTVKLDASSRPVIHDNSSAEYFDAIILCSGFGIEKTIPELPFLSYWDNDNLARPAIVGTGIKRVIVSGAGDGGLIDVARLTITDFDHGEVTREFYASELEETRNEFLRIERCLRDEINTGTFETRNLEGAAAEKAFLEAAGMWLGERYSAIGLPAFLREKFLRRLRLDTKVWLNDSKTSPFSVNASLMNRFILWMLLKFDAITYHAGYLQVLETHGGKGNKIRISKHGIDKDLEVDEIIVRHGPEGSLMWLLAAGLDFEQLKRKTTEDQTWKQQYPSFISKNLVHYDNRLWESLIDLTHFLHSTNNLTAFANSLKTNADVVALGYCPPSDRYLVYTTDGENADIVDKFMDVPVTQFKWPVSPAHYKFSPCGTNTIHCGEKVEFTSDRKTVDHFSRLGFFIQAPDETTCAITAFHPSIMLGSRCCRAELDFSQSSEIGTVTNLLRPEEYIDVNETQPSTVNVAACAVIALGNYYTVENVLPSADVTVTGSIAPSVGVAVLNHSLTGGVISRTNVRASISVNGMRYWFDNCFSVVPTTSSPFVGLGDEGSPVITEDGLAVGIVIGISFGQALVLPIIDLLNKIGMRLLVGKHLRTYQGILFDNFRPSGWHE